MENKIVLFQEKQIRRVWHQEDWSYSVSDTIAVLTESKDAKAYWRKLKQREPQLVTICHGLKLVSKDGRLRVEDCANTEGLFRIIQSIPSPKAEPFKLWLAQVGYERVQEIENPELAANRARQLYQEKGYSNEWIEMRLKSIAIRQQLTDEWKGRGVKEGAEYSILTAEIARATFGLTPSEHKDYKGLQRQNLRDHMTNLELIFTMLGEETTKGEAVRRDAKGFQENRIAAIEGGNAAGDARIAYENRTGQAVVTDTNFLPRLEE
jgi:DNA-damage-inducible protein D